MAIFYPVVGGDDVNAMPPSFFWGGDNYAAFGCALGGQDITGVIRFPNINIPKDATITEAYVKFTCYAVIAGTPVNVNVYFNDIDNAVAPTNYAEIDALDLTTEIAWNAIPVWADGTQYDTPDIKTILQSIVDRAGWASGNALMVVVKNNGSTSGRYRRFSTIEHLAGVEKAELHITWTVSSDAEIVTDVPSLEADVRGGGYLNFIMPSLEALLRPPPFIVAEMPGFNAAVHGSQDVIYGSLSVSVPSLIASIEGRAGAAIYSELPALTAALHYLNTGLITLEIPSLTANITASLSAQVEASLPILTTSMLGGARNEVELPVLTTEMEGLVSKVGSINISIPCLVLEMTGKVGYLGDINVNVPKLITACQGNIGRMAGVSATVPILEPDLKGWAEPGDTEIRATMPSLEAIAFLKSDNRFDSCEGWQYG